MLPGPEAAGEFEQDFGIRARFSWRRHGLPDPRDPALGGGHGAFLLLMQGAGEDDVRVVRGFVEEKIDRAVEFQLLHRFADEVVVGQGDDRVEADRDQPFDLAPVNCLDKFVCGEPLPGSSFSSMPQTSLM